MKTYAVLRNSKVGPLVKILLEKARVKGETASISSYPDFIFISQTEMEVGNILRAVGRARDPTGLRCIMVLGRGSPQQHCLLEMKLLRDRLNFNVFYFDTGQEGDTSLRLRALFASQSLKCSQGVAI